MKIAVEGCCHGELDKIYETLALVEREDNVKIDLLLCCGDFQAVRNKADLQCMAVPSKFQKMNTFYKYYSGEKKAPVLTLFIGGNHEASNYLQELPYGGWVAPNIYYMGYASVMQYGGLRIGGLSGIYKGRDYAKGHFEKPPYNNDTKRSAYHVRNIEVFRLKQLSSKLDIMMSHDWPRGVYNFGDVETLLKRKTFFVEEVNSNTLGSPAAEELLYKMKPDYWFSAHLHVKFPAVIKHQLEDGSSKLTKFLALDKCLPRRKFLQVLDIPHDSSKPLTLEHDPEWLVILKSTDHLMSVSQKTTYMPGPGCSERWDFKVKPEEIEALGEDFGGEFSVPNNFKRTAPAYNPSAPKKSRFAPEVQINPQTTLLCEMLDITDPLSKLTGKKGELDFDTSAASVDKSVNPEEISIDDVSDEEDEDDADVIVEEEVEESIDEEDEESMYSSTNPGETSVSEDDYNSDDVPETSVSALDISQISHLSQDEMLVSSTPQVKNNSKELTDLSDTGPCVSSPVKPKGAPVLSSTDNTETDASTDLTTEETSSKEVSGSETDEPKVKKFKRRNQLMYSSNEDTDN